MKKYIYILLAFCMGNLSFAQSGDDISLRERIYVQTDKPLYLSGELMWIKAFTTDADGKPLDLSKVGYVELLDETTSHLQAKLELNEGLGEGSLILPATLPTANYRLVAYTRYMQNEGENVYFNKVIPVINTFVIDNTIQLTEDSTVSVPKPFQSANEIVSVYPSQSVYKTRSVGEIRLENIPDDIHTLSISIAGREAVSEYTTNNIQQWYQQMSQHPRKAFTINNVPEMEGHILKGKLIDMSTNEPALAEENTVALLGFVNGQVRVFTGRIDKEANVTFYTKRVSGTHEIVTTTMTPYIEKYRVDIQSPFASHTDKKLAALNINPVQNKELLKRSISLQVLQSYMADSLSRMKSVDALFRWKPDWNYMLDNYTRFATMGEVVIEFIPGLRFRRIGGKRTLSVLTEERVGYTSDNSLILLDGIPIMDHEIIYNYDPLLVKQIEVYRGKYQFGNIQFDGIASFKTYDGNYPGLSVSGATQFFDYEGTQSPRYFYTPSYHTGKEKNSRMPDYRHTLLWKPCIESEGNSAVIPFTTSDLTGEYIITVEGLTKGGQVVWATSFITVE